MLTRAELDAAIVAVPHDVHASLARAVLDRGLHLLLEKPMTIRPPDARALAVLAKERGVELIIGYPWHYNRQVLAVRDAIADGRIGTIEYVSCQFASIVRELYRGNPEPYRDVLGYSVNPPGPQDLCRPRDRRRRAGPDASDAQRGAPLPHHRAQAGERRSDDRAVRARCRPCRRGGDALCEGAPKPSCVSENVFRYYV